MSLSEKISELDRRISSSVQGVLAELRTSLKQQQSAVEERLASLERTLPSSFIDEGELSRVTGDAASSARHGALLELREALAALDRSPSQAEILRSLLHESRRFAPRAAVFITHTDAASGWEDIGFPGHDQAISTLTVAYATSAGWATLAEGRGPAALSAADCAVVASHLGVPIATGGVLIPIVLADCVAAALYADRPSEGDRFEISALQMLAFVASQAIEGLAYRSRTSTPTLRGLDEATGAALPLWSTEAAATDGAAAEPEISSPDVVTPSQAAPPSPEELQIERDIERAVEEVDARVIEPAPSELAAPTSLSLVEDEPIVAPQETVAWANDVALPVDEEIDLDVGSFQLPEEPPPIARSEPERWTPPTTIEPIEIEEPSPAWNLHSTDLFAPPIAPAPAEMPLEMEEISVAPALEPLPSEPLPEPEIPSSETFELPVVDLSPPAPVVPAWRSELQTPPIGLATTMISNLDVNEDATILIPRRGLVPAPSADEAPPAVTPSRPDEDDETVQGRQSGLRQLGLPRTGTSAEVAPPRGFEGPGLAFVHGRGPGGDSALQEAAHRLARLLVNEIKLYNEEQVLEGRRQRDIYSRLRDEIERSRKMFEQQTSPEVRATRDYFTDELVRQLADGDSGALGQ